MFQIETVRKLQIPTSKIHMSKLQNPKSRETPISNSSKADSLETFDCIFHACLELGFGLSPMSEVGAFGVFGFGIL
jgi:hypothetical protein